MKSVLVVSGRDCFGDFAFHFNAQMVSKHELFGRNVFPFSEREDCGKNGDGRVDQKPIDAILRSGELGVVKIIRVNGNTVNEGGKAC